jgi:prepilin-type N-terminal cleavage/methylation domain-containing protein
MKTTYKMRQAEGRRRNLASATTLQSRVRGSRFELRASTFDLPRSAPGAFTLIELLVVISIIGVLAALTFPAVTAARTSTMRARAKAELIGITTAIERYQQKIGYYPPDNAPNWSVNQLYYELLGTTNSSGVFHTLDDSAQIATNNLPTSFGGGSTIVGFMNCSRGGEDGLAGAMRFLSELKSSQFMSVTITNPPPPARAPITVLGTSLDGPLVFQNLGAKLSPWCYNSSSPQHNPKSYDLWIDIIAGGKTNRICNWNDRYLIIGNPEPAYP